MRVLCTSCDSREVGHWCSQCGAVLPTPENENYYSILGLPQKIHIDEKLLKERFFDLNRAFHPDRAAKIEDERLRDIAVKKSALINNSFNALRDRTRRIQYLVRQQFPEREEQSGRVPMELFDLVEQINELIADVRAKKKSKGPMSPDFRIPNADRARVVAVQLEAQLRDLLTHREAFEKNLSSKENEWDALCDKTRNFEHMDELDKNEQSRILEDLAIKMDEISYIDSLIRRIKDALYE